MKWRLVYYPFGFIKNLYASNMLKDISTNQLFYDRMNDIISYKGSFNDLILSELKFINSNKSIVSYMDMCFEKIKNLMVSEVVIGPKAEIDDNDLRLFLMANGYDLSKIVIRKSKASYR